MGHWTNDVYIPLLARTRAKLYICLKSVSVKYINGSVAASHGQFFGGFSFVRLTVPYRHLPYSNVKCYGFINRFEILDSTKVHYFVYSFIKYVNIFTAIFHKLIFFDLKFQCAIHSVRWHKRASLTSRDLWILGNMTLDNNRLTTFRQ